MSRPERKTKAEEDRQRNERGNDKDLDGEEARGKAKDGHGDAQRQIKAAQKERAERAGSRVDEPRVETDKHSRGLGFSLSLRLPFRRKILAASPNERRIDSVQLFKRQAIVRLILKLGASENQHGGSSIFSLHRLLTRTGNRHSLPDDIRALASQPNEEMHPSERGFPRTR